MENSENEIPSLDQLPDYVEALDQQLVKVTKLWEGITPEKLETLTDEDVTSTYEALTESEVAVESLAKAFFAWEQIEDIKPHLKSEVSRSMGQHRRYSIVCKNALRICREHLGLPDPERSQEEMQLTMQRMSVLHR